MRVLVLLTDGFGGHGGIGLYNRDLITALCAHPECEEVVAIPRLMTHSCEPLPDKLTYVICGINGKLRYVATTVRTVRKNPRFDLIVCGHINLLPIAFFLRRWIFAPLLLEIYGIDAWRPTGRWLADILVNKIDAFISISQVTKTRFLEWTNLQECRGVVIPNAVHAEHYGPGVKNPSLLVRYGLKNKTVLLTVGRLSSDERYKGVDETMELLPDLKESIPNIAYLIVGDGSDRQRLEEKAMSLGIADRVAFSGFVPEGEKADHYRLADVYVMPSTGEGFGFVFLEAMACGIPVIASKRDGSSEAVRYGELGILVDPTNREEIRAGILEALKIPRGTVPVGLEYFSFRNFTRRLHDVIDGVIGKSVGIIAFVSAFGGHQP